MKSTTQIYAKGDTCLLINPYDSFHLFTVYNDWTSEDPTPLDLTGGNQTLYLTFKSKTKEVKIPEFTNPSGTLDIDKSQGQVLFKISKEKANIILSMTSDTFYITRIYEIYNADGEVVSKSDEEVIYVGKWMDEKTYNEISLSSQVESLTKQLRELKSNYEALNSSYADALQQVADYSTLLEEERSKYSELESKYNTVYEELSKYIGTDEYDGTVISNNAVYINATGKELTEEEMKNLSSNLTDNQ